MTAAQSDNSLIPAHAGVILRFFEWLINKTALSPRTRG